MLPDSLHDWRAPLLALLVSLAWAALLRRRGAVAELGLGVGALLGFVLVLGVSAAPAGFADRLPALMAGATALAVPLALLRGRLPTALLGGVLALAGGWWLAGAPAGTAALLRALPVAVAAALAIALLLAETAPRFQAVGAAALLAALLVLLAPPGPWVVLALALLAAALGALPAGTAPGPALRLPLAAGLAALMLGPALGRGAPADWLPALGTLGALLLAPRLAGRAGPLLAFAALALAALALALLPRLL